MEVVFCNLIPGEYIARFLHPDDNFPFGWKVVAGLSGDKLIVAVGLEMEMHSNMLKKAFEKCRLSLDIRHNKYDEPLEIRGASWVGGAFVKWADGEVHLTGHSVSLGGSVVMHQETIRDAIRDYYSKL